MFKIRDTTNNQDRLFIHSDGEVDLWGHVDIGAGLDVTGNITVTGTVDGVDIAALNTTVGNITTDVVTDTSPQLGGDLDTNGHEILLDDNHSIKFGAGEDLQLIHNSSSQVNRIDSSNQNLEIRRIGSAVEDMAKFIADGGVELFHNGTKKFETLSSGAAVSGDFLGIGTTSKSGYADRVLCINRDSGAGLELRNNSSSTGQISFSDTSASAVGGYRGYIQYNHNSGIMRFGTQSAGRVELDNNGHFRPNANNTYDLGTTSLRWRNIYTLSLIHI